MSKSAILVMMCLLISSVVYSQMSYDFKTKELKEIKSGRTLAGEVELKSGEILKGNFRVPGLMNKAILLKEFPSAKVQIKEWLQVWLCITLLVLKTWMLLLPTIISLTVEI